MVVAAVAVAGCCLLFASWWLLVGVGVLFVLLVVVTSPCTSHLIFPPFPRGLDDSLDRRVPLSQMDNSWTQVDLRGIDEEQKVMLFTEI